MEGNHDYLHLANDKAITKLLTPGERIVFSCKVIKFNKRNKAQERTLMVTSAAAHNLKGKKIQRTLGLNLIKGVTKSRGGDEFIFHCPDEYDYRFSSPMKDAIIEELSKVYNQAIQARTPLYIWETPELSLRDFATTKADKKRGVTKIPSVEAAVNYRRTEEAKANRTSRAKTIYSTSQDVTLEDFTILKVLGRGSFGKVMMVRKNDSGELFAMKSLRKDALLEREQVEHTRTEKQIMMHVNHPFLVKLEHAFSTPDKIYFVMRYMRGGELFFHLKEARKFPEDRARFYAVCVLMGLGHLHSQNIVYRDLKPENILMDDDGYVCLTDFGMAKQLGEDGITQSFVGTPEYLAPEIITSQGHGRPADWWSLGILIYEMLVGIPPFYNQNIQLMYELIRHGELKFPQRTPLSPDAQDLITRLLNRDPARRLGARGVEELKTHPFFASVDWNGMLERRIPVPFKPRISAPESAENFDEEFTSEDAVNSVVPDHKMRLVLQHQDQFNDF